MLIVKALDRDGHLTVVQYPNAKVLDEVEIELPLKCDICTDEAVKQDGLPEGTVISRFPDKIKIQLI